MGKASQHKRQVRKKRDSSHLSAEHNSTSSRRSLGTAGLEIILTIILFIVPKNRSLTVLLLILMFLLFLPYAWKEWFKPLWLVRSTLVISSLAFCIGLGWNVWPEIKVRPKHVTIENGQSYRFRVKNDTADDAYSISPLVYLDNPSDSLNDFDVDVESSVVDPRSPMGIKCTDSKGRKVLVPMFAEMAPNEERWFDVTYKGYGKAKVTTVHPAVDARPGPSGEMHGSLYTTPLMRLPPDAGGGTCAYFTADHQDHK